MRLKIVGDASSPSVECAGPSSLFSTLHVSTKIACLIPARWSLEDYARHTCNDRSHLHLSRSEYEDNLRDGSVELIRYPDRRLRRPAVVRIVRIQRRGLSRSVGETLAVEIALVAMDGKPRDGWPHAMLAQIRMRRETPSAQPTCEDLVAEVSQFLCDGDGGSISSGSHSAGPRSSQTRTPAK